MKKIIHIVSDEKFINSAYWQFNTVFPNQNTFYLLVDNLNTELKYGQLNEDFKLIKQDLKGLKVLAKTFVNNEIVVFHGFDYYRSFILNNLSPNCTTVWMLWGAEVYNNPRIVKKNLLYGSSTYYNFLDVSFKSKIIDVIKNSLRPFFYAIKHQTDSPNKSIFNAIKKVDYCGILYKEEFEFIQKRNKSDMKFLKFSYYPIELMLRNEDARVIADNILLGNSASATNNHLEAFELLQNLPIQQRKIIVPLSYGDSRYANNIIKKGKELLRDNFKPLVDFLPLHDYNEYIEQCGIVIMNHYRQQAVGNVLTMIWMGAKVYLDERNTLYHYLKRIGIIICSIQKDLSKKNPKVFTLLSINEQDNNRKILKEEIGQEYLLKQLQKQFEAIIYEY